MVRQIKKVHIKKSAGAKRVRRLDRVMELDLEREWWDQGIEGVVGVDEAGRGPLAGPVVAAAVIMPRECAIPGVYDSKGLKPEERNGIFLRIRAQALAIGVGAATAEEIDVLNILQATHLAAGRAIGAIEAERSNTPTPRVFLTDFLKLKVQAGRVVVPLVKGDARCHCIAAASIVAKVVRDQLMQYYDDQFPGYGLGQHKGYPTLSHKAALETLGPTGIHRRTFSGVPLFAPQIVQSKFFKDTEKAIRKTNSKIDLQGIEDQITRLNGILPRLEVEELTSLINDRNV